VSGATWPIFTSTASDGTAAALSPALPQAASSKAEAAKARVLFVMCDLFMYSSSVMDLCIDTSIN
jgi:hypothetical protein